MSHHFETLKVNNKLLVLDEYVKRNMKYRMKCMVCDHEFESTITNKLRSFEKGSRGCPECTKRERYGNARDKILDAMKSNGIRSLDESYDGRRSNERMQFYNSNCGHVFETTPNAIIDEKTKCTECYARVRNGANHTAEFDVLLKEARAILSDHIPELSGTLVLSDGASIGYSEERAIAVFMISINETNTKNRVAQNIRRLCDLMNIRSILFFQDEWINKQSLLILKLQHIMGLSRVKTIGARQTTIREIESIESTPFLNTNHIQGADKSTVKYGAFYKDELVAVMTFTPPRVFTTNTRKQDSWELSRFATSGRYRVVGVASKLLKHFESEHKPSDVFSYADKRWSVGNLYNQLGFAQVADNPAGYFYNMGDGVRRHRWQFQKNKLKDMLPTYDATLTEEANMEKAGYYRVWDCGTLKFVKRYSVAN